MSLLQQIIAERDKARKEQDSKRLNILSFLIGEINRNLIGKEDKNSNQDLICISVLNKLTNSNNGILENYSLKDKPISAKAKDENLVYSEFLPVLFTKEELETIIKDYINTLQSNQKVIKNIISYLKSNTDYLGKIDNKLAMEIIKQCM